MQKLIWTNSDGDSIDLTSGNYGITNWEGFSNTPLNIQSQQVPFQDGGVFIDALLEERELSVTLAMQDNGNLEDRYRMRIIIKCKYDEKINDLMNGALNTFYNMKVLTARLAIELNPNNMQ